MVLKETNAHNNNNLHSLLEDLNVELNRLSFPWPSMQQPDVKPLPLLKAVVAALIIEGTERPSPLRPKLWELIWLCSTIPGTGSKVCTGPTGVKRSFQPNPHCSLMRCLHAESLSAIRAYDGHIDGLVTFCDHYQERVAVAALELSLPACSPEIFAFVTDMFRLRLFEGHEAYQATSVQEATTTVLEHSLEFPLIFNPRTGYISEGVE